MSLIVPLVVKTSEVKNKNKRKILSSILASSMGE